MEFRILGSMEVLDGTRRIDLPAGRARALLALLVLHAGETVPAERPIEERAEAELALGRAGALVGDFEKLVKEHPFRERLRELLMLALYRGGRQADALQAYRDAREALIDELGIEPGPTLRKLQESILR